jgi:hypothetical protein
VRSASEIVVGDFDERSGGCFLVETLHIVARTPPSAFRGHDGGGHSCLGRPRGVAVRDNATPERVPETSPKCGEDLAMGRFATVPTRWPPRAQGGR